MCVCCVYSNVRLPVLCPSTQAVIVEAVGVGQSEVAVINMVDAFVLLQACCIELCSADIGQTVLVRVCVCVYACVCVSTNCSLYLDA